VLIVGGDFTEAACTRSPPAYFFLEAIWPWSFQAPRLPLGARFPGRRVVGNYRVSENSIHRKLCFREDRLAATELIALAPTYKRKSRVLLTIPKGTYKAKAKHG
jgi:hypothetical protein